MRAIMYAGLPASGRAAYGRGQPLRIGRVRMLSVPAGARLVLRAADGRRAEMRSLATVPLADGCLVPVLVASGAFGAGEGLAEVPTDRGLLLLPARLAEASGRLEVSLPPALHPMQRRDDVRGAVDLPL